MYINVHCGFCAQATREFSSLATVFRGAPDFIPLSAGSESRIQSGFLLRNRPRLVLLELCAVSRLF